MAVDQHLVYMLKYLQDALKIKDIKQKIKMWKGKNIEELRIINEK